MNLKEYALILSAMFVLNGSFGQFSYFNNVYGISNDGISESSSNIEIVGGSLFLWGGGIDSGEQFKFYRSYNELGVLEEENQLVFNYQNFWGGETNSFQNIPGTPEFLMSHAVSDAEGINGILVKSNINLDTIWTRTYRLFNQDTYFFTHTYDGEDIVIAGEYGLAPGERGTFIAKIDTSGEVLWHQSIHAPEEGVFRNREVSSHENRYVLTGSTNTGINTTGHLDILDESGNFLTHLEGTNTLLGGTTLHHSVIDDEVIVTQTVKYEDYEFISDPAWTYTLIRLHRLNLDSNEFEDIAEIMSDNELVASGVRKIIKASDEGYIINGTFFKSIDGTLHDMSYILKVDTEFQLQWFTELAYDPCTSCTNALYDLEQAPDGGYVMVGKFDNEDDPRDKTWLVKVDACGDLEWQGCEAVGIGEFTIEHEGLELFPNPASDVLRVDIPSATGNKGASWQSLQLIDLTGKVVLERSNNSAGLSTGDQVSIDVSDLLAGLYSLNLTTEYGNIYSEKLVIE